MEKGYLILETGEVFEGKLIGRMKDSVGEVVFNTSMTGYQEILTDPSYSGQIITFCYPIIGNYGINLSDDESMHTFVSGVIIGDLCETPSHYQSVIGFSEKLDEAGIPGLTGVDTRLLVKTIRNRGTVKGFISRKKVDAHEHLFNWSNQFWIERISTKEFVFYKNKGPHLVLVDYGFKKSILNMLLQKGCSVTVAPYNTTFAQMKAINPDGVLFSNGPGDPMELEAWLPEIQKISQAYPTLGICLGHQLIALAYGAKTKKLAYGHRGANHPVKELKTGKVRITAQNHGYVVLEESINQSVFHITYRNVNDQSVEGLRHAIYPIQTVQFHPEAHAGPCDTVHIFQDFIKEVTSIGEKHYAVT